MKRALSYPLKLIAKNAGVNGSVVSEKVFAFGAIGCHSSSVVSCIHPWCFLRLHLGALK